MDILKEAFRAALDLAQDAQVEELQYRQIPAWDSTAHMILIAEIEERFGIMLPTEDVLDLSSFAKAVEIVQKHGVSLGA